MKNINMIVCINYLEKEFKMVSKTKTGPVLPNIVSGYIII